MTRTKWKAFPHADKAYTYAGEALEKHWERLHAGDREPFPSVAWLEARVAAHPKLRPAETLEACAEHLQEAWRAYHRGDFGAAAQRGEALGLVGANVAAKALNVYATYLVEDREEKLRLFLDAAHKTEELQKAAPDDANAFYLHAQALGRYSQGISIAKALAQGLGGKVRHSLDAALRIEPKHADAHIALGAYHAEIVDKIGGMIASVTYGASKEAALKHYQTAIKLNPTSAIARTEYANGLAMLFGKSRLEEATALYEEAAKCKPADAMERLDVEAAKEELED
jgi:tetratricopeptide (TPR) repeat protein